MKYSGRWTAGLDDEYKKKYEDLLAVNNLVLDRLTEICYNMINDLEVNSSNFEKPDWALRQAHAVGQRKALTNVISLCTPAKDGDNHP